MASKEKENGLHDAHRYDDEDLLNSSFEDSEDFTARQDSERPKSDEFLVEAFPDSDFDQISPGGVDYSKRTGKGAGLKIAIGIIALLIVIAGSWYALKSDPISMIQPQNQTPVASTFPQTDNSSAMENKLLKEVEADFSPSPETLAAEESLVALNAAQTQEDTSSASSKVSITSALNAPENKTTVESKPVEVKKAESKVVEAKPAKAKKAESKVVEAKPAKAKKAEDKAVEAKPVEAKKTEDKAVEAKLVDAKKDESQTAQAAAVEAKNVEDADASSEISKLWVVNISSTPDADESMKLLSSVLVRNVGGQVYTYKTNVGGKDNYRIRVGFFNSKEEAEEVGKKISENIKLSSAPWVVQPTVGEVQRMKSSE